MTLGFLIGQLSLGGAEKQVYLIARELHHQGIPVVIFTFHGGGFRQEMLEADQIPVVVIPRKGRLDWGRVWRLRSKLKFHQVDVLFCFGSAESFYGRLACWGISTKPVMALRSKNWGSHLATWIDRVLKPLSAFYIANSHIGVHYLQKEVGVSSESVLMIPNAVNVDEIMEAGEQVLNPRTSFRYDGIWIGWVGKLVPIKGPELLVEVARLVCQQEDHFHILVAGGGYLRPQIEILIEQYHLTDRVHLTGALPNAAGVWRYVDIGLNTSQGEGTPNVLLEGMVWGRPFVAPPVGEFTYIISNGENGLLAENRSADELAEMLLKLIRDKTLRLELGRQAKKDAEHFWSPMQAAQQYFELAQKLIAPQKEND